MTLAISLAFWWIWQSQTEWAPDAEPTGMHHLGCSSQNFEKLISLLHDLLNSWWSFYKLTSNKRFCLWNFHHLFLYWRSPFCQDNFLKTSHPHKKLQHIQQCLSPVLCPFSQLSLAPILFLSLILLIFLQWNYPHQKNLQFL